MLYICIYIYIYFLKLSFEISKGCNSSKICNFDVF